jgi:pilus assembly protein CpaB
MNKRIAAVVATIVLAIGGVTALLVHAGEAEERAFDGAKMIKVLRVDKGVAAGASAEEVSGAVELVELPATAVPEGALADLDGVGDQVTLTALVPGDLVLPAKFGEKAGVTKGEVPDGLQRISVQVAMAPGLAGKVSTGDVVGVLANYGTPPEGRTGFIAEQALVLAVDKEAQQDDAAPTNVMVSLAVDGVTAAKVSHAATFGTIWLTKQDKETKTPTGRVVESKDVFR